MMDSNQASFLFKVNGSILIYVLWILVVISVLAFQLTSASRVITLNRSAVATQLKNQMQIDSAVQFAIFKIIKNQWNDRKFELNLNNQTIAIQIYNESGFISFYELSNKSLKNIFNLVNMSQTTIDELENIVNSDKQPKFNSFNELLQFEGIDNQVLDQLIPLVSIFHTEAINPQYSPVDVLILLSRVDQYSVQKLREAIDEVEREQLRDHIIESLSNQGISVSDDISRYFRVYISIENQLHRVFLHYNRSQKSYRVVSVNHLTVDMDLELEQ